MKIRVEVDRKTLCELVAAHLRRELGDAGPESAGVVTIETKSVQNYKAEWETADFRAVYEVSK